MPASAVMHPNEAPSGPFGPRRPGSVEFLPMAERSTATTSEEAAPPPSAPAGWRSLLPSIDAMLLILALAGGVVGKYRVLRRWHPDDLAVITLSVTLSDLAFCALAGLLLLAIRAFAPSWMGARIAILLSIPVAVWSMANMAWIAGTGVQLHVGVVANLVQAPRQFGPVVLDGLTKRPGMSAILLALVAVFAALVIWRLVHPGSTRRSATTRVAIAVTLVVTGAAAIGSSIAIERNELPRPWRAVLGYSSHWFALTTLASIDASGTDTVDVATRNLPRVGERDLGAPAASEDRPHVVVVVLESVAHWTTSFAGIPPEQTPTLTALADQGIHFRNTRCLVTHTTQSHFSILTGMTPDLSGGYREAVLVDRPYESLATILGAAGYRTRASQMVKASFECNPGLFANLGFESFWSREDLNDDTKHIGYVGGDDFEMIEPAFDWFKQHAEENGDPCFMLFVTSVAHHPYLVPKWFGTPAAGEREKLLQSVRYTDTFLAAIVNQLKDRGVLDNTLLCVIADHGESVGQHGIRMHNDNPYEEVLRIPWVISWPDAVKTPRAVESPCSVLDVTPTVLSLLGYEVKLAGFEGFDALGPIDPLRRIRFCGWGSSAPAGFVAGARKTVFWPATTNAFRYDLQRDAEEKHPERLSDEQTASIQAQLHEWRMRNRIIFDARRYRETVLYDNWRTFCFGNKAWCYYAPKKVKER